MDEIRDYFGEEIAFYFMWTDTLKSWLMMPALLGIICTVLGTAIAGFGTYVTDDETQLHKKTMVNLAFAVFMIVWAVVYGENWKRKRAQKALEWGMDDFSKEEKERPDFTGPMMKDRVTGQLKKTFTKAARR
jgi:hypothetical protein